MEIIISIGVLILIRYFYILIKYIKTKEFKKKKFEGNIVGLIACTSLTIFIINILILFILVDKNIENELNMWMIFLSGIITIFAYPGYWILLFRERNIKKRIGYFNEVDNKLMKRFNVNEENDKADFFIFNIPDNAMIDEKFNNLISTLTNDIISFIHPKEYNNVLDVYSYLYLNDYIVRWNGNDSVFLTCQKINMILKKIGINKTIKETDITNDDDEAIKLRRKEMFPTLFYDLNIINKYIKKHIKGYEIVGTQVYSPTNNEILDIFICIGKTSLLKTLFDDEEEGDNINE